MRFRQKTLRATLVMIVVLLLAPMSVLVSYYISAKEDSIHASLQSHRFALTQLSNDKHLLSAYAMRLNQDKELSDAVQNSSDEQGLWQTPAQQIRIQFTDGIKRIVERKNDVSSAALDWMDSGDSESGDSVEVQKIGLNAKVSSVPHAIDLIASIKALAKPFPVRVQSCGYENSAENLEVAARCLLVLETWDLPFVKTHDTETISTVSSHQSVSNEKTNIADFSEWRIFNSDHRVEDVEKTKISKSKVLKKPPKRERRESKAVINGPAGRLVIHAHTQ